MTTGENPTATNVEIHDYEPYGIEMLPATNQAGNTHKFTGHERDALGGAPSVAIDYMHFRYYGTNLGRFMKPDNGADQNPMNPQSWNLCSYVKGNPVNFKDPTGHATDLDLEQKALRMESTQNPVTPTNTTEVAPAATSLVVALAVTLATKNPAMGYAAGMAVKALVQTSMGDYEGAKDSNTSALMGAIGGMEAGPEAGAAPKYAPTGEGGKPLELPNGPSGEPVPSSMSPHTQIGTKEGSKGPYIQTRTWGENGQQGRRTDWTDHGRPDTHSNPHDHPVIPNPSGGTPQVGPPEPHRTWPE
jgi:RHS repeat-associated protein